MKRVLSFLLLALCPSLAIPRDRDPYLYACSGNNFMEEDAGQPRTIVSSPDGRKRIAMTKPKVFAVSIDGRIVRTLRYRDISAGIETGWSPDSTQFFVMYSAGGAIGDYHVHLFRISSGKVVETATPRRVAADFHKKHSCATRTNNLLFLGWTADSTQALLVAEVYPTSDCEKPGLFRGYLVDTRDAVIRERFGEQRTERIKEACRVSGVVSY
ncbi:MAG TPA: hypothetical protein VF532_16005 [Candidatus Angelobacter sp.]